MSKRIAVFGQAAFGKDVLAGVVEAGHEVVGVYAPPEGSRPDPMADFAAEHGLPLFRHRYFRRKGGAAIESRIDEYRGLGAELNLMPYTTVILPPEIVDGPELGSLCFHPSLLPRFRGGAAIPWQIILGEKETGVSVFRPDAGVDTGPLLVQRGGIPIESTDNAATLYFQKLYPLGVEAMLEAVARVDAGDAHYAPQDEAAATFQGLVGDAEARVDWEQPAAVLDRLIRGCDPSPGAHCQRADEPVRLFDARLEDAPRGSERGAGEEPAGQVLAVEGGRVLVAARGGVLSFGKLRVGGAKKGPAAEAGLAPGDRLH